MERNSIELRLAQIEVEISEALTVAERERSLGAARPVADTTALYGYLKSVVSRNKFEVDVYRDLSAESRRSTLDYRRLTPEAAAFMEMQVDVYDDLRQTRDEPTHLRERVETFHELFDQVLAAKPRVALIGDPGAGKSTTLVRVSYEYAQRRLDSGTGPVPIRIDLSGLGTDSQFSNVIEVALVGCGLEVADIGADVVLIVDGLNETPKSIVNQISSWCADNPSVAIIVACRKIDYVDRALPLRRVDLLPLDLPKIRSFLAHFFLDETDRDELFWGLADSDTRELWQWFVGSSRLTTTFEGFWFGEIGPAQSYEPERRRLSSLQTKVRSGGPFPGMLEVVRNPFLLFQAVRMFVKKGELPGSRSELLRSVTDLMIGQALEFTGSRASERLAARLPVRASDVIDFLSELAYNVTDRGFGTEFSEDVIRESLGSKSNDGDPIELIELAARRSGILDIVAGGLGPARFRHQIFQEYFASLWLLRQIKVESLEAATVWGNRWWEATPWDEVSILAAEAAEDPEQFAQWLAQANPTLAFRCANMLGLDLKGELGRALFDARAERTCPIARAEWGRREAVIGDSRPGVGLLRSGLPDISWIMVPAGKYTIGGEERLKELGIFVPRTPVTVDHHFFIAKYQVTYAQFGAFVDNGYSNDRYWTREGLQWRGSQLRPRFWEDPTVNISNHPVVGVTWFEAVAFASWVDDQLFGGKSGWEISLPTEAEWEVACRYPDNRVYPWGDRYEPGMANIDEVFDGAVVGPYSLRRTCAVGLYERGVSALGVYDMWGNVWEWCISRWDVEYRFPENVELAGTQHRGVRGNSWYNSALFLPAAHDALDPDFGVNDTGVRLVKRRRAGTSFRGDGDAHA